MLNTPLITKFVLKHGKLFLMDTYFYIARHFWKDGKNASWQVAMDFPAKLLENFKNEYTFLENNQPDFRQYDGGTVFFSYKQSEDVYGRRIIEITAATCGKRLRRPESVINLFKKKLQSFDNVNLNIVVNNSNISYENNLQAGVGTETKNTGVLNVSSTSKNKLVVAVLVGLIMIIGLFFLKKKNRPIQAKSPQSQNMTREEALQESSLKDKQNNSDSIDVLKSSPQNLREIFLEKYLTLKALNKEPPYIKHKCVSFYIQNQLDNDQERRSFKKWINDVGKDKFKKCEEMKNVKERIKEIAGFLIDDGIDMNRKKVEDFFNDK